MNTQLLARASGTAPRHVLDMAKRGEHLAALNEWAHFAHHDTLKFDCHSNGPVHAPEWTATLHWHGIDFWNTGASKQEAMTKVARFIMEKELDHGSSSLEERVRIQDRRITDLEAEVKELRDYLHREKLTSMGIHK